MRILLWHGYLLGGTGSNVYTRQLAREWSRAGHEVTVLCQEPHPERFDVGGATVVRPDVGGLLPVFVLDRYEGYEVRLLHDCLRAELDRWVAANAEALRERLPADLVFCNHVLLGGAVGRATGAPYAVKAHGSELEYSMRGRAELEHWGAEALAGARAVVVGSAHIRQVLEEVCGHVERVHEVPPGVDVDEWRPRPREEAFEALLEEARRDAPNPGNADERRPDEGNSERLAAFLAGDRSTVVYFGKLIENKGVHLLLEALERIEARAVIVGFGDFRAELERRAGGRVLFTGPLEHRHLAHLLALADVAVVPSIFPEAFGMVAAEAAACGCPPLVARHSGLAEIAEGLEEARRDAPNPGNADERRADDGNAERLAAFLADDRPTVVYFGKLLFNKGVHLLLEALQGIDARAVVVGFGDYREDLERLADPARTLFTGPLEHRHLVQLLPLADVCVVPSIFPEAFGMVAAEAAAAGCPPLVARHSGLAEVAEGLEAAYPPELRELASFATGDASDLHGKLAALFALAPAEREALSAAARRAAVARWSWAGVAERLLALGTRCRFH